MCLRVFFFLLDVFTEQQVRKIISGGAFVYRGQKKS